MKYISIILLLLFVGVSAIFSAQVRLAWDPPTNNMSGTPLTDLAGYKLLMGYTSGVYTVVTDVGNVTTTLVSNLTPGKTYYFAVRAYNVALNESPNSNELMWQAPPIKIPNSMNGMKVIAIIKPKEKEYV